LSGGLGLFGGDVLQSTSHTGFMHFLIFNPPIKVPIAPKIAITHAAIIVGSAIYYIFNFRFYLVLSLGTMSLSLVICKYIVELAPSSPAGCFVMGFNILILQLLNCAGSP
jgi:hypothetical protein